jgi:hypothetical protein
VTRRPSFITGMKFRSGSVGPCILWEKVRPTFIDPTKVGSLVHHPPATYSSFSLRSWWSSSIGFLPLSSLEEAMILLELRTTLDRNSSKRKHDIQTSGNPGGYIGEN